MITNEDIAQAQLRLAQSQARAAVTRLTIQDALQAKSAIEVLLKSWQHDHPYQGRKILNLAALVGVPGATTWLAHFEQVSECPIPDVVFEVAEGTAAVAAFKPFYAYQFDQAAAPAQEGGQA